MSWNEVYNKYKNKFAGEFTADEAMNDKGYIVDIILDTFPFYSRQHVETAVEYCTGRMESFRKNDILDYLSRVL